MRQFLVLCFLGLCVLGGCEKSSVGEVAEKNDVVKKSDVVETRVGSGDGDSEMVEKATFGGGCFWGTEAAFRQVKGVAETAVGYMGGDRENPTYKDVCSGTTGHAEVVQVKYDPAKVSYGKLLEVFWKSHNPTTLNRQGPDVGTQYRSVIFFHSPDQQTVALASKEKLQQSGTYRKKTIVTEVVGSATFNLAEDYHQQYLEKRGLSQCHF